MSQPKPGQAAEILTRLQGKHPTIEQGLRGDILAPKIVDDETPLLA